MEQDTRLERLVVDGLDYYPYSYTEEFRDGSLGIEAFVDVDERASDSLFALMSKNAREGHYFPVSRVGISDEPLEMRFGVSLWSQHDGRVKHKLFLVDKAWDEREKDDQGQHESEPSTKAADQKTHLLARKVLNSTSLFNRPQDRNARRIALTVQIQLEELLALLQQAGTLTAEQSASILAAGSDGYRARIYELYRVPDVDTETH